MNLGGIEFASVSETDQMARVAQMAREIWREHYIPIVGRPQIEYMLSNFQSMDAIADQIKRGAEYYLCRFDGEAAGYFAVDPDREAGSLLLSKLYVCSSRRGSGLGCRMLEFSENICRSRGLELLWLTVYRGNRDSIAWYKRRGFANCGVYVQDIGGGYVMNDYRMEKRVL